MRYHHLGLPVPAPLPGMTHIEALHIWASDHQDNPYGIQHMLYETDCPVPELVRTRPHLAFVVDDLDAALAGKDVIIAANSPSEGVRVAFIADRGEPVELLEFDRQDHPWTMSATFVLQLTLRMPFRRSIVEYLNSAFF